jgi:DMSO reductase anchor subunit
MIYASTRRVFWNPAYTGLKFLLTCLVLGIPVTLLIHLAAAAWTSPQALALALQTTGHWLSLGLIGVVATKLLAEVMIFSWLRAHTFTPLRRTALLMTGDLARVTTARFTAGVLGGLALPALLTLASPSGTTAFTSLILAAVALMLVLNLVGELLERYLFFSAVVAPKMPGAPTA